MQLDLKTHLFSDISPEEARQMRIWCESVLLKGEVPSHDPEFVVQLTDAFGLDRTGPRRLVTLSTVIPQRLLLSLVRHHAADPE
jgi:hypothetical protein